MPRLVPPVLRPGHLSTTDQPTLAVDETLALRPWESGDASALLAAYQDPVIRRWHSRSIDDVAEAEAWIAATAEDWRAERDAGWAIVDRRSDSVTGRMALRGIHLAAGQSECSYWVLPAHRGKGIAPRALDALSRWALDDVGFERLWLDHALGNEASCRVATKAGFAPEGTLRRAQQLTDGWHDVHLHARVRA